MQNNTKKQIFSGIQPTGDLHFGNYFGAVSNWVTCQAEYDCVFSVVDYHAITMPYQAKKLRENAWDLTFNLLALGVKPENLFIQSMVPEHAELCWLLNCFCSYGELQRMTQFKDKSQQAQEKDKDALISVGLFDYPVLQAADILIYKADFVPVGKDQEQHLELSRNIAQRFNQFVGKDYFPIPECLFADTPKIMSLADPTRKMSKSLGEKHYIGVFEPADAIARKVRSAVTDTGQNTSGEMSPGTKNLFDLLKAANTQVASRNKNELSLLFETMGVDVDKMYGILNTYNMCRVNIWDRHLNYVHLFAAWLDAFILYNNIDHGSVLYDNVLKLSMALIDSMDYVNNILDPYTVARFMRDFIQNNHKYNAKDERDIVNELKVLTRRKRGIFDNELLLFPDKPDPHQSLFADYEAGNLRYSDLKQAVTEALTTLTEGFRAEKEKLNENKKEVKEQIKASASQIRKRTQETLKEVKDVLGLQNSAKV